MGVRERGLSVDTSAPMGGSIPLAARTSGIDPGKAGRPDGLEDTPSSLPSQTAASQLSSVVRPFGGRWSRVGGLEVASRTGGLVLLVLGDWSWAVAERTAGGRRRPLGR